MLSQSIYVRSLSEHFKQANASDRFKAKVDSLIQIGIEKSPLRLSVKELKNVLNADFASNKLKYGNRLGIGESAYFLVFDSASIDSINDGQIRLSDGTIVDTKFIFGNEIRDASRFVHLEDYSSQNDLNVFTEYLNNYIRDTKIASETKDLKVGDAITVIGACEVHPNDVPLAKLFIYPVTIKK